MGGNRTNQGLAILRSVLSGTGVTRFGNKSALGATSTAEFIGREPIARMTPRIAPEHSRLASYVLLGLDVLGYRWWRRIVRRWHGRKRRKLRRDLGVGALFAIEEGRHL